jgi:hypothetical protein
MDGSADFSRDVSQRRGDRIVVLALIVFAVFFRLATLMMIHTGVDERDYWYSAKCLAQGWPYPELTHRTVRFAVILPVAGAQLVLGESPNVYYVLPILNAALQAALAFAIGARLRGRAAGFLAAFGIVFFPYMIRAGSQVRPEVFSITYVLAALWCFLAYLSRAERGDRATVPLLGAAAFLFVAYEANVTNLFFAPGLVALILARKRRFREVLAFCGLLLALYLVETGLYAAFTEFKFGQLQVIAHSHLEGNEALKPLTGVGELFSRYAHPYLQSYWQATFLAFAACAVYFFARRGEGAARSLVVAALGYFFCITFAVKSLVPLVPAEPFINRYFCAVLGPVVLVVSAAIADIAGRLMERRRRGKTGRAWGAEAYVAILALAAASVVAGFSADVLPRGTRQYAHSVRRLSEHPLALNLRYREEIDRAWDAGGPIVAAEGLAGSNALESCTSYYLSADKLPNGTRPKPRRVSAAGKGYLCIAKSLSPEIAGSVLAAVRQPFRIREIDVSLLPSLSGETFPHGKASKKN